MEFTVHIFVSICSHHNYAQQHMTYQQQSWMIYHTTKISTIVIYATKISKTLKNIFCTKIEGTSCKLTKHGWTSCVLTRHG